MAQTDTTVISGNLQSGQVTIGNGASLSGAADLANDTLLGVLIDTTWTAAVVTFAVSADGTNFFPLYDRNGEVTFSTVAASVFLQCDPGVFAGWRYVKVRSGTNGTPVNQGGARTLTLVTRTLQR